MEGGDRVFGGDGIVLNYVLGALSGLWGVLAVFWGLLGALYLALGFLKSSDGGIFVVSA